MKKIILLSMALAAVMTSCQKFSDSVNTNGVPAVADNNLISFYAEGDGFEASVNQTKAAAVTSLNGFNVEAFTGTASSAETLVFNTAFTNTGTITYTGDKYWPSADGKYNFYASNATIKPSDSAPGANIDVDSQTDVVVAKLIYNASSSNYKKTNTLTFNHILARLGTVAVTAPAGYEVTALSVKIKAVSTANYLINAGAFRNLGSGTDVVLHSGSTTPGTAGTIAAGATVTATATDTYLIPTTYQLYVDYTLKKGDWSKSYTKTASLASGSSIVGGAINDIKFTLPEGEATKITFKVEITPWASNTATFTFS